MAYLICKFCKQEIEDRRDLSGDNRPDYCTVDWEDFGCDESPDTNEEECGDHIPLWRVIVGKA